MPNQYRQPTFAEMLLHAERACTELEVARQRLRLAINQEVRDRRQPLSDRLEPFDSEPVPAPPLN